MANRNNNNHHDTDLNKQNHTNETDLNKMTREEAGRKGGEAKHKCRGRECSEQTSSTKKKSNTTKDDNSWGIF